MKIEYIANYFVTGINSKSKKILRSHLRAQFKFDKNKYKKPNQEISTRVKNLKGYLEKKENLTYIKGNFLFNDEYFDGKRKVEIKIFKRKPLVNLEIFANEEMPRKDMLDLDSLMNYINTGIIK